MTDDDDKKARARARRIETARELEQRGFVDHAVREYVKARAPAEAARLLAAQGRQLDAAKAILDALKLDLAALAPIQAADRDVVAQAASFFEQSADPASAKALRDALAASAHVAHSPTEPAPAPAEPAARVSAPAPVRISTPAVAPSASAPPLASPRPTDAAAAALFSESRSSAPPVAPSSRAPAQSVAPSRAPAGDPSRPVATASFRRPERPAEDSASVRPSPRPAPEPSVKPPQPEKLSASGGVVSEYSGSREAGWRDAGSASLDELIRQNLAAGKKGAAARIAWDAGRPEQALPWFRELGLHQHAGACLRALGRNEEALAELLAVEPGPHYRRACLELVPVARALNRIDFDIDRFLTKFVDEGPRDPADTPVFVELARLYRAANFPQGARRCVAKVFAFDPNDAAARALKAELDAALPSARPSAAPSARGLPPLPSLEEFVKLARDHAPRDRS